jgi:hypothetical protein
MIIPKPSDLPAKGFYYHFKHDPDGPVNNYAYEVIGVGIHTEDDCDPNDAVMVGCIPLYDCPLADQLHLFQNRPLASWMKEASVGGAKVPRYTRIIDPNIIAQLKRIRAEIYGKM